MIVGSVILVTYNSAGSIERCLAALRGLDGWERIVVDNASRDGSLERAKATDPEALLVANDTNLGFGAAINRGARMARGKILLFLNPDAIAQAGALDALARVLEEGKAGAVGGALLDAAGEIDRGFAVRRFPTTSSMMAEILLLNQLWPRNPLNRSYRCLDLDYAKTQEVDQPAGACLAVSREAFDSIGGFDESFFPVWFEDVDLCRRLRNRGWTILYSPQATFAHSGGHSVNQLSFENRQLFWYHSLLRYFRKHASLVSVAVLRGSIALGMMLRMLATFVGIKAKDATQREALRAYLQVIRRCALAGPSDTAAGEPRR